MSYDDDAKPLRSVVHWEASGKYEESTTALDLEELNRTLGRDNTQLEHLGYKPEFRRDYTFLGVFSLCSSKLAVLPGVAGTIWYTMGYCGLVGMTHGWWLSAIMGQFLVYALAELASTYPTAGGLYYWAFMTAPPKYKKLSCYIVAWSLIISIPLSCCSITYSAAQMLIATMQLAFADYKPETWHIYLAYLVMMFISYRFVCTPTKYLSYFNMASALLGVVTLLATVVLLPYFATERNSATEIFTQARTDTGWPIPWAFCMTFLSATWTLSGYDVAVHVAEETVNAAVNVPRAMVWSTWTSAILGFAYLTALAVCATDIESLISHPLGQPIGTLTANILGQNTGVALLLINFLVQFGCGVAFFISASRIFFACARDKALPGSEWLCKINVRTQTPNNASLAVFLWSALFGSISLASEDAFEAFFSGSTLAGSIAYLIPVLGRCLYEDNPEHTPGPYNLGRYSKAIRWIAVAWTVINMPVATFPDYPNPSLEDMNWAVIIYIPLQVAAIAYWFIYGYKTFLGPVPNLNAEERIKAHVVTDHVRKTMCLDAAAAAAILPHIRSGRRPSSAHS